MKSSASTALLGIAGMFAAIFGSLAILATVVMTFLLMTERQSASILPELFLTLTFLISAVSLCMIASKLFRRANRIAQANGSLKHQPSDAERASQLEERNRKETSLFSMSFHVLAGIVCLGEVIEYLYRYFTNAGYAQSVNPLSFWFEILLGLLFGVGQLVWAYADYSSSRAPAGASSLSASTPSDAPASDSPSPGS